MYNEPCKLGNQQAAALTEVRQFQRAQERIEKALGRLNETIEHVNKAFAPVILPPTPTGTGSCEKEGAPPQSEFERFIAVTEARIHLIAQEIDHICERSSV
jgi:hypothetical protein